MARQRVLLVDGNNILHAWEDLQQRQRENPSGARRDLIHRLNLYRDASGIHVVVVFDGRGSATSSEQEPDSLQVFYSASGQTADAILEQLARSYANRYDLSVATDDLAVQNMVIAAGALAMSSQKLRRHLDSSEKGFRARWKLG